MRRPRKSRLGPAQETKEITVVACMVKKWNTKAGRFISKNIDSQPASNRFPDIKTISVSGVNHEKRTYYAPTENNTP
jgi:hypothetical protein